MKIGFYTYLAVFFLVSGLQSLAQSHEVKFKLLPGKNGVALGKTVGMTRDRHGAMWFADQTNHCITRYDGNNMTRYYDPKNTNLPGGKHVEFIMADSAGFLWIAYNGMGINRFDPETNTYAHYEYNADDPESLSSNWVSIILIDRFGNLWVGSQGGLDRLDPKSGKFIHYRHNPSDSSSLSNNNVRAIYEDSQGTLWVGTGFSWDRNNQGGLNRFNRQQNNFTRYLHDPANPHSLIDNKVRAIFEDDHGNFWIGTRANGIHLLDRKSGRIDRIPINTEGTKGLIRPPVTSPFDHITFITQDATGFLWFGTENAGVIRYDPLTKTSLRYKSNSNTTSGFTDNSGWWCYVSPDGPMWLSTGEGSVFQVDIFTNTIPEHISDSLVVNDITEETDSILWMGTQNGVLREDLQNGSFKQFRHDPQNPESISDNIITAVAKDSDGMIWLGTPNGLNMIDPRTYIIKRILHDPNNKESLSNNNIKGIFEDKDHILWIATNGGGLNRLDKRTEKFTSYVNNPTDTTSISENLVAGVLQDDDGSIWVRTNTFGLNRLDIATGKFRRYLQGKPGMHFFKDSKGVIWVSTDFGIYCYNKETDKFYQPEDLKAAFKNEVVNIISEDHQQNIWMATSNGIYRLDQKNRRLIRLGRESGIYAQFVHTIKVNQKGHLRLINANGYYVLDPNKIKVAPIVPKINFTNLIVNGELAKVGQNEILKEPFSKTKEIILSYEQNIFSIGVEAIDYSDVATKAAYYKLEGYDKDWRELTSENQVYYFGVPPGTYRFIIEATNRSNGVRVEKSFSMRINPPWWNTIWAYIMYAVVFVGIIYGALRIQKDHLELEKAKEVDRMKTSFFTNISHEFRTPLTLIKGPAQTLLAEFPKNPKVRDNATIINQNAETLLKLINQLLSLAKLEAGSLKVEKNDVNLNDFLTELIHSFRPWALQKQIDLAVALPPYNYLVSIDKEKTETILSNLVSNALKFTPQQGKVGVNVNVDQEGSLKLTVADTGIGIKKEECDKVFEKFYQVGEGGSHHEQGTGIGLSLVKDLTELLGGKVEVKSVVGKGSEFSVNIPVHIIKTLGISDVSITPEVSYVIGETIEHDADNGNDARPKILIVEDHEGLRKFIAQTLKDNYEYFEAEDGQKGLDLAMEEGPDLIISDIMMPNMDGVSMLQKIKKDVRTSHIPVILLTAKSVEESKIEALESGADDYLTKPFDQHELIIKVRNTIASRMKLREKIRLDLFREAPKVEAVSQDERFLARLKNAIQDHLGDEQLSVDLLAKEIGISRAHFYRKVTALSGQSVNNLIRDFRLQKAKQLLDQHWGSVSQVAYEVGFSNPSYFTKCFKERYGKLPSEYPSEIS